MVPVPGYLAAADDEAANRAASVSDFAIALFFSGRIDEAIAEYRRMLNWHSDNHSVRENPDRAIELQKAAR